MLPGRVLELFGDYDDTLTNPSGDGHTVQGEIHRDPREVYVEDVSQQKLGYDIRLEGASLVNNQSTLSINSVKMRRRMWK